MHDLEHDLSLTAIYHSKNTLIPVWTLLALEVGETYHIKAGPAFPAAGAGPRRALSVCVGSLRFRLTAESEHTIY